MTSPLSDRDRKILAIERQWWQFAGSKESEIREQLDMSTTRFNQRLNQLIDEPAAMAYDPITCRRLREIRDRRRRSRVQLSA